MRGKDLFEKITDIDDQLLMTNNVKARRRFPVERLIGAVACLVVLIIGIKVVLTQEIEGFWDVEYVADSELPQITLSTVYTEGSGFEGCMAYNISDLMSENPWNEESELTYLPVITNQMNNAATTIEFESPVQLPSEYNFTYEATYEELYKVAEYLQEAYVELIDLDNPVINIYGGDYGIDEKQNFTISFYEESDDEVENILNYNFKRIEFYCDDNGELFLVRKYETDLSDEIGNYPVISVEEATALLENGNYTTTVPEEFSDVTYIANVELVYKNSDQEEVFVPYYRFYVELSGYYDEETGLNTYGAYYVPAIESQYIENMPVWTGEFN